MFEGLTAFITSLIPVRLAMGLFVSFKLCESVYECINTDMFKSYLIDKDADEWKNSYYLDIFTILINVITFACYCIAWYITRKYIDDDVKVNLRELRIERNAETNEIVVNGRNIT